MHGHQLPLVNNKRRRRSKFLNGGIGDAADDERVCSSSTSGLAFCYLAAWLLFIMTCFKKNLIFIEVDMHLLGSDVEFICVLIL